MAGFNSAIVHGPSYCCTWNYVASQNWKKPCTLNMKNTYMGLCQDWMVRTRDITNIVTPTPLSKFGCNAIKGCPRKKTIGGARGKNLVGVVSKFWSSEG